MWSVPLWEGSREHSCTSTWATIERPKYLASQYPKPPTPTRDIEKGNIAMTTPTVVRVKKLINRVEDVVPESLAGLGAAHPDLVKIDALNRVVLRAGGPKRGKVGLVSGGGSGHEPLHGGFVGLGMLDAACAGNVFTSPTPDQMEAATRAVDGGVGVFYIVKNYTGDVLNF